MPHAAAQHTPDNAAPARPRRALGRSRLNAPAFVIAARWTLALVLIAAAIAKISNPAGLASVIAWLFDHTIRHTVGFNPVSEFLSISAVTERAALPYAVAVIAIELTLGLRLLVGPLTRRLALAVAALMLLFTAVALVLWLNPVTAPPCWCFGDFASVLDAKRSAQVGVLRNAALSVVALWLFYRSTERDSA